ncbi:MAG: hypothetical protein A2086_03120 [Spirochaetes bacterium GWD1_27_9]|nr:MAG: hypothetical protein A2Z98_18695 [Spirochaetes bacterium GWB1_27_13]OHD23019.1 MAG: hypothetical protein A2Y34_00165 [Spirochaetes bacterium GWC1_27_15]OHD39614.1 MAG: hypothetical protein A2086_03120 [Spirochaetes bacterium GWD1_27_9]
MRKLKLVFLIVFSFTISLIYPQTIELELLQKKEKKINTYYNMAMIMKDKTEKTKILEAILNEFDKEGYSAKDKKIISIAEKFLMEGVFDKEYENGRLINDFPEVRLQAVKLLAKIGGDNQRDLLMNIFISDDNLVVKAEACEAFIQFGETANGDVVRTIIYVYRKYQPRYPKLIFAMINALREFITPESPSYYDAIYLLTEIQMGSFNDTIREKAGEAMNHMMNKVPKN